MELQVPKRPKKMTPMLEQYFYWREKYPGCILFFRMGDFYECFFDDAKLVSSELDIALTSRDQDKATPMAGVPHHAVEQYASRLIEKGYKIAICEQMTPPDGRTLVEREVIKILTPGTFIPEEGVVSSSLAALYAKKDAWHIGFLSPTSSKVLVGAFQKKEAQSMLLSFSPKEIVVPAGKGYSDILSFHDWSVTEVPPDDFNPNSGKSRLCRLWGLSTLSGFGLEDGDECIGVANALVAYAEETSFSKAGYIRSISKILPEGFMHLDWNTQANLDLWDGPLSLYQCINSCVTPFGKKLLREWLARPLCNVDLINRRLDAVEVLYGNPAVLNGAMELLSKCSDVERAVARLHMKSDNPRDLGAIRDTLDVQPELCSLLGDFASQIGLPEPAALAQLKAKLDSALMPELPRVLGQSPFAASNYDEELDKWRALGEGGEAWLSEYLEKQRSLTGIPKLKISYNRVFGYCIEISRAAMQSAKIPDGYVRRQTLANSERFITEELKSFEDRRMQADIKIDEIERKIFEELSLACINETASLQLLGGALSRLDVFCSFASLARERNFCRPEVTRERKLEIREGRHPMVELALRPAPCIPNDLTMDLDARTAIVTGPNMAGKSTYLRMVAILQILAQMGSFVPALSAKLPLTDRLFTRIGARDELAKGNSTFMVEMSETANILHNVTNDSLVILDEIGRGTSTYDGMSIAWSVIEYIHTLCGVKPFVLFATHYHELSSLEAKMPGLFNLSMAVEESSDGVKFLHKVQRGAADRSYGIEVARIAGLPRVVLKRARELLEQLEKTTPTSGSDLARFAPSTQVNMFDFSADAFLEEVADIDPDSMSPRDALKTLYKMVERARKLRY